MQLALFTPGFTPTMTLRITSRTVTQPVNPNSSVRSNVPDRWKMKEKPVMLVIVVEQIRGGEGCDCHQRCLEDAYIDV